MYMNNAFGYVAKILLCNYSHSWGSEDYTKVYTKFKKCFSIYINDLFQLFIGTAIPKHMNMLLNKRVMFREKYKIMRER